MATEWDSERKVDLSNTKAVQSLRKLSEILHAELARNQEQLEILRSKLAAAKKVKQDE